MGKFRTSDAEWLKGKLYNRWQIIRRHPDYRNFCIGRKFENGTLGIWESLEPEAKTIMDRFGLEMIYDPSVDFPEEDFLAFPVFKDSLAVRYEWRTVEKINEEKGERLVRTTLWDEHYIKLKIDISPERPIPQILSEVRELIEGSRQEMILEKNEGEESTTGGIPANVNDEAYKVWDLRDEGKEPKEIIQELWPEEYERQSSNNDFVLNAKFEELRDQYKKEGKENWFESAYNEVYGDTGPSGTNKLYQRVADMLKRMEGLFKYVDLTQR